MDTVQTRLSSKDAETASGILNSVEEIERSRGELLPEDIGDQSKLRSSYGMSKRVQNQIQPSR